ncbi:MAG: hypothetical protein ACI32N_10435 [Bulleidia sp.]
MNALPRNRKDILERNETNQNTVIADLASYLLFDRQIRIKPEDVCELNPHVITVKTENGKYTEVKEQIRDGLYAVVVKCSDHYEAFYCGVEPQTKQETDLFFRFVEYNIRTYNQIIEKGTGEPLNKEEWEKLKEGEHLPYIIRNLPILPIITIYQNFSDQKYTGRVSVDHAYEDQWNVDAFGSKYRIVCFDVFDMPDEDLAWFGEYGVLLGIIKYQHDVNDLDKYMVKYYQEAYMSSDTVAMINLYSNAGIEMEEGEVEVKVYKSLQDLINRGRKEGIIEGKEEGRKEGRKEGKEEERENVAVRMLKKEYPIEEIISISGLTLEQLNKLKTGFAGM